MITYGDGTDKMQAVLLATLMADVELNSYLTGGIYDATTIDDRDGGMDWAPKTPDKVRIAPFAFVRWKNAIAHQGNIKLRAERQTVEIYLHEDFDFSTIDLAASRIKELLHDTYIRSNDTSSAYITYTGLFGEFKDESLNNTPMKFIRFQILMIRK